MDIFGNIRKKESLRKQEHLGSNEVKENMERFRLKDILLEFKGSVKTDNSRKY
jgi:hypothetical protein